MVITRDRIVHISGSWYCGVATLSMESGASVHADNNGEFAHALESAGVVERLPGRTIQIVDDPPEIVYMMDDVGIALGGLCSYDDWLNAGEDELEPGVATEWTPAEDELED